MKKSNKKTEASIVRALNDICETLKLEYDDFSWLTHFVDYVHFPQSLKIIFVFTNNQSLVKAKNDTLFNTIFELTESRLKRESVTVQRIDKAIYFDTEENGANYNDLKWCQKYT